VNIFKDRGQKLVRKTNIWLMQSTPQI